MEQNNNSSSEQAVIIKFNYHYETLEPLFRLDEEMEELLREKNIGEYDGHEIASDKGDGTLYFYGPDAQELFIVIKPVLSRTSFMKGANAKLRFGPPESGVKEIYIDLE